MKTDPIALACKYRDMMKRFKWNSRQLAHHLKQPHSVVSRFLMLLRLDPTTQDMVRNGFIDVNHAAILARIDDPERRREECARVFHAGFERSQGSIGTVTSCLPGVVYLFRRLDGVYKVGNTRRPSSVRRRELEQSGNTFVEIGQIVTDDVVGLEQRVHKLFDKWRHQITRNSREYYLLPSRPIVWFCALGVVDRDAFDELSASFNSTGSDPQIPKK